MELRHPFIFIILLISISLLIFFSKKKTIKFQNGTKIANTSFIRKNEYFQQLLKKYNLLKKIILTSAIISIFISIILLSRPNKIETRNQKEYNRDIFLCMDISSSVDELNMELIENLKETITSLKNERFGISIFNTSSVTLVPLTDDYEYVIKTLDEIKNSIKVNNPILYDNTPLDENYLYSKSYIRSGTLEGSETRGSSLIGDGLASCIFNFSNLEEDRTRIIIFSTDNDLAGTPIVTLNKASQISKDKNIKVFGVGTTIMKNTDRTNFKKVVELTGGKFYDQNKSSVKNIISDIEKTSKSLLEKNTNTTKTDTPELFFIILVLTSTIFIILSKQVIK